MPARIFKLLFWFTLIVTLLFGIVYAANAADEWDPHTLGVSWLAGLGPATAASLWIAHNSPLVLLGIVATNLGLLGVLAQAALRGVASRRRVIGCAACVLTAALVHAAVMTFVSLQGSIRTAASWYVFPRDQLGLTLITDAVISMPAVFALAARILCRSHRVDPNLCLRCGYDLRASTGRCPECGTALSPASSNAPK